MITQPGRSRAAFPAHALPGAANHGYTYEAPVRLGPQRVRLRPRGDNLAALEHWHLAVDPEPSGLLEALDAEGTRVTYLWFEEPTEMLHLRSRFTLHTEPDAAAAGARCPQPPGWDAATALELRRHFLSCLALREGDGDPVVAPSRRNCGAAQPTRRPSWRPSTLTCTKTSSGSPARRVGHCCRRQQRCRTCPAPIGDSTQDQPWCSITAGCDLP